MIIVACILSYKNIIITQFYPSQQLHILMYIKEKKIEHNIGVKVEIYKIMQEWGSEHVTRQKLNERCNKINKRSRYHRVRRFGSGTFDQTLAV